MDSSEPKALQDHQNVVVIRHGDRMDNFDPMWVKTAKRPWDPPLAEDGRKRAFCKGRRIRTQLGFPIHRVFVSPFLRCVQTAFQVVSALCAVDDSPNAETSDDVSIDPSKVKASIEYGLCEMLNNEGIRTGFAPKDGELGFNISELEAMLPAGTVDSTVERVYKELPQWGETAMDARARCVDTVQALADKYPTENLLLVTHGNGVRVAVSALKKETTVYKVEYCAYAELRRPIVHKEQSFTAESFEVLTRNGQTGISFLPPTAAVDGVNGMA